MTFEVGMPVLVTTKYRGVFYGRLEEYDNLPSEITLSNARNCLYWHESVRGFLGLAATGPSSKCRIGAKVASLTLWDITSVTPCDDAAAKAWENQS